MADRYWVGGTGNWDSTTTTNWSATTGGASGASVPTVADNVFFDANSNVGIGVFTVTMASSPRVCNDFLASGLDGVMTLAGTSIGLTVSGSLTFQATNFTRTYTGTTTFNATTTGKTVTTNGVAFGAAVTFNGVGGAWTLGSAISLGSNALTITNGTFNTSSSGNYAVTASFISSNTSNVRTINLNASTITLLNASFVQFNPSTNLTLNAGTSTITCGDVSPIFAGGGLTYYNVAFTATAITSPSITGVNTFNNLSVTATAAAGVTNLTFAANQTINGTLSTTGTAGNRRVFFASATYGIGFTLTVNSAPSLTDADFRDIYVIGTAAPISGTRIGNRGNCSGITFDAAKTVYWYLNTAGTVNWSDNFWAATSGGTVSTNNFPLPQDTAIINNTSALNGAGFQLDGVIAYVPTIDMSTRTLSMTFYTSNNTTVYGNWTNGSGVTFSNTGTLTFSGGTTQTITSAGKTFTGSITVDTYGGTVQLADALNTNVRALGVTNGTFDTQNHNVTASSLNSSNSNVRTINFGSSTVTLITSGIGGVFNAAIATNLTFNAGTSTIVFTDAATGMYANPGLTFYNVSFTSTGTMNCVITGSQTFNNFTVTAPALAGLGAVIFDNDQTINGTLTCAGATAVRRLFLRSNISGTTRTLTVNSLSATDCDIRNITIAGTAVGSSPTRAGDCGGNTGITFPVAKTVYWNLAGTQNWSATGWCTASGGTPAINNFPLAQDTAVFDNTGSAGTVTIDAAWNIGTFDASARTSAMTFSTSTLVPSVYGNWLFGTGVTSSSTTGAITFSKNGTQTITSNGVQFGCPITSNNPLANVQLADALSLAATRTLTLTTGTFDAVSYNVTTGLFINGSTSNTLKMGSGTWTLSGTGTVWNCATLPTIIAGTSTIVLSDTSTTARTFAGGSAYYNKLTIGGATGISTLTISGDNTFGELASTKTVAHTIAFGSTGQTFGKWSVTGTVGNVVTITGTSTTNVIAGPAVTGIDYLVMGTWGISTTSNDKASPGEFYAGANSTGTAAAPVFRTAAPTPRTLYWVGGTGNWSSTTKWATSSGGASGAAIPTSLDAVIFDSLSNATAYTATIDAGVTSARCASFTMAGPLVGNVTFAGTVPIAFQGNVSFSATGITRTYTGVMILSGNSSLTFTTNGLILANTPTINGIGATWTLGSALTATSQTITVTNGTFDTSSSGNYAVTCGTLSSNNLTIRTINLNASTLNFNSTAITFTLSTNLTFNAGTSQINCSVGTITFNGGSQTFYNVTFSNTSLGTMSINGANTFNNFTYSGRTVSIGIGVFSFNANQTINGTLTVSAGTTAAFRTFIASGTIGTTRTLTCAAVSFTDTDFRDITIAGAASPASGTRLGDGKGNSGITFPAAKTVYYGQTGSADWGAEFSGSWSATSGGALDATQFPLAQDTAVFPAATYPASNGMITINANYNIGTIDMSLRTSNLMTLATGTFTPQIYGNWINGTGITISGTGVMTFAGRGSQTITSAGRTFTQPTSVNTPGGSVTLQDGFTNSNSGSFALAIFGGTFDANNYNVTFSGIPTNSFQTSGSTPLTIAMGSGTWTIPTAWVMTATAPTITGSATISMTRSTAKTFTGGGFSYSGITLNQGGAGTLTVSGNNTFANITNTVAGATTINLAATTTTVGAWTATGTVGNLLTITGTSAASPATLIYTGAGAISGLNYLVPTFIRAYSPTTTWYAGANSTNGGTLGWIFTAASGTVYNVSFIDTATATDAFLSLAAFLSVLAETATATDSPSVDASTFNAPVDETATATDSPLVAPSTFNAPVSETATATDSDVGFILFPASIAETATATDSDVGFILFPASIAETATATDSVLSFAAFYAALAEAATATDSVLSLAAFNSVLAETATATDAVLSQAAFSSALSETATATDSPSVAASTFNAPVAETATATDSVISFADFYAALAETATATDSDVGFILFPASIAETATATDAVLSFADFYAALAETATATDSPLVAPSTFNAPVAETATATDAVSPPGSIYNAPVSETVTISDLVLGAYLWNLIDDSQSDTWQNVNSSPGTSWSQIDDSQSVTWQNVNSSPGTTWSPIDTDPNTGWTDISTVN